MIYERIFETCKEQYEQMSKWMEHIVICLEVLTANNSTQTIKNGKILKRISRIEEKLKIVNIEEKE